MTVHSDCPAVTSTGVYGVLIDLVEIGLLYMAYPTLFWQTTARTFVVQGIVCDTTLLYDCPRGCSLPGTMLGLPEAGTPRRLGLLGGLT